MNLFVKISTIVLYEFLVFVLSYVIWHHRDFFDTYQNTASTASIKLTQSRISAPETKLKIVWKEVLAESTVPKSFKLEVPFTAQAPYGNWSDPWQEFCEEAVILMTAKYYKNQLPIIIPATEAAGLMRYIMALEEKLLGYHENTGSEDIAKTIKKAFGLEARVIKEASIEKIKDEILRYRPVIIPAAGKRLGNPYFQKGGPFYHTVLVIGYDDYDGTFIVHEPGTRFGREYRYNQQKLFEAMADWSNEDQKVVDKKVMVVIE